MMKKDYLLSFVIISLMITISSSQVLSQNRMLPLYSWKVADYVFPDDAPPEFFMKTGEYNPANMIILDASVWEFGDISKVFVTTPRMQKGTPASLSIVSPKVRNNQYLLQPYPDWSWHRQNLNLDGNQWSWNGIDCNKMISVFRTTVDESCGRLWVVDTGFLHAINKQVCPPKLLIFDLNTDKLISKHTFPKDVASKNSLLITIVVDIRNNKCDDVYAYIADVVDYKLIVYDHKRKASWNMESHLFYPYPLDGVFRINGVEFDLMDGIFGLALGPVENNDRNLYFHSLASVRESWVPTSIIRNESLFANGGNQSPRSFQVFNHTRSSQSASEAMSDDGILFFGLLSENSIACWNSRFPFTQQYLETVAQDDVQLQFASGLKVNNGKVWVTSSRFQNYFTGVMKTNETNFRILVAPIEDLVKGTTCSIRSTSPSYSTFRPSYQLPTNPYNNYYSPYSHRRVSQS